MIALTSPYLWYTTRATGFVALILFTLVVALGTFVANRIGGTYVGRFELNEFFATEGGHIGYVVLPEFRRRGYATEILRQALTIARAGGVDRVLMYCLDNNIGSIAAIERCGGVLDEVIANDQGEPSWRRYWID